MAALKENDISNTAIVFLHETRTSSQVIYSVTLLATLFSFCILPFIYTTISVKGTGALQSNIEKTELLVPVNGKLIFTNLKDNERVTKGKLLIKINADLPQLQSTVLNTRATELRNLLNDVSIVFQHAGTSTTQQPKLQTSLYLANWQQFSEQLSNAINAKNQTEREFMRYESLYAKKVVTLVEYETYKYKFDQAVSDWKMVTKKYKTQWQTESIQYSNDLRELQNQKIQLSEQEKLYTVVAPISGSIQNLSGMQTGTFVYANQKIGEISPDSALLAFCYVKPSDIGLIKRNQEVQFQIDAFNYNQWGLLKGEVTDISDDVVLINQSPFFKVKCKLAKNYLQLKNGYRGQIKKGMTLSARFTVTRRNLFQLLYDKVDDWLNPAIKA